MQVHKEINTPMHKSTKLNQKRQKSAQKTNSCKKIQHELQINMKNNKIHGKNYEKFLKLTALNNLYEYLLKMKIIKIKKKFANI